MTIQHELQSKVACLESKVDMLESELAYLNTLLVRCGFPKGIDTLKSTVEEILTETSFPFYNPLEEKADPDA